MSDKEKLAAFIAELSQEDIETLAKHIEEITELLNA